MCLTAKNFGLQEENINITKPQGKTNNWENESGTNGQKERERESGREDAVLCEKGG